MSLLMQALQKAAKNRETSSEIGGRAIGVEELTLQPLEPPPGPSRLRSSESVELQAAKPSRANREGTSFSDFLDTNRQNLLWVLLLLVILGMGTYFGLQLFAPSLFISPPAISTSVVTSHTPTSTPVPVPVEQKEPEVIAPPHAQVVTDVLPIENTADEKIALATKSSAIDKREMNSAKTPSAITQRQEPSSAVTVKSSSTISGVNPKLAEAYGALKMGDIELADQLYTALYQANPTSIDVLLGLAVITSQKGDTDRASKYYVHALELDPKNGTAQAGLIGIFGALDPISSENRLKLLISREPSSFLYFTLGNLYADQSKWAAAQDAYFQAYHLEPDNADYAYNLSISLERISQPKIALHYYKQALQLAQQFGRASFDTHALQKRIELLTSSLE